MQNKTTLIKHLILSLFAVFLGFNTHAQETLKMTNGSRIVPTDGFNFYDSGGPLLFNPALDPVNANEYNWTTWYQHNEEYTLTLTNPNGGVQVEFSKLRINNDTLKFYDGEARPENLIGEFCNNEYSTPFCEATPLTKHFKVVSHGTMTIQFISDFQWRDEGWEATITRVASDGYTPQPPVAVMAACDNQVMLIPTCKGNDDNPDNDHLYYKIDDGDYQTYTLGSMIDLNGLIPPINVTVKGTIDGVGSAEKIFSFSNKIEAPASPTYERHDRENKVTVFFPNKPTGVNDTYYIRWTVDNSATPTDPSLWIRDGHEFQQPSNTPNTVPAGDIDYTNLDVSTPFYIHIATRGTTCPETFSGPINIQINQRYVPKPTITFVTDGNNGRTTLTCSMGSTTIYYTTDGSEPDRYNYGEGYPTQQYSGSYFTVPAGTTVKAIAVRTGFIVSDIASAIFVPGSDANHPHSGVFGDVVLLDDREDHSWSYYSDTTQPIHRLKPVDVKITYYGYGNQTMTSTNMADGGLTNADFNANVAASGVAVNYNEAGNQFVYLKTLENDSVNGSGNYRYTVIANPFQKRPKYNPANGLDKGFDEYGEGMTKMDERETMRRNEEPRGNRGSVDVVPVADADAYSSYVPLYTYWCDYGFTSEYIIPASYFQAAGLNNGDALTSITLYQYGPDSWVAKNLTIRLTNTSTASYSSTSLLGGGGTEVYNNASYSSNAADSHTFTFNDPFTYTGNSLIVQISAASGGTFASSTWSAITTSTSQSYYVYGSSSTAGSLLNGIPCTSFTYNPTGMDCTTEDFSRYNAYSYNVTSVSSGDFPDGWTGYTTGSYLPHVSNNGVLGDYYDIAGFSSSTNNFLYMIGTSTGDNYTYTELPAISNLVSFSFSYAHESANYGTLYVGYVPNGFSTINYFNDLSISATTTLTTIELTASDIANVNNDNGQLIFVWSCSSAYGVGIDDVQYCVETTPRYTIAATTNPAEGGTVSGAGIYLQGTSVTLTATPAEHYTFTNWTEGGSIVSTNANYTFTATANRTLVANFTEDPKYTITVTADPAVGGTVSGGGSFYAGESVTLTATPATSYNFINWKHDGSVVSTNPTYSFTVSGTATYTATFEHATYATIPFFDDFESGDTWEKENGSQTNKWTYGTAASNGGTYGLYITNGSSGTYGYNNYGSSASMVFAYKEFTLPAGNYTISYDWRAYGENSSYPRDYLRVALVPYNTTLTAGTTPSNFSYNSLPSGWIALDGGSQLYLSTSWQSKEVDFGVLTSGDYKLVFAWKNDGSVQNQPPAAIDNVRVIVTPTRYAVTCNTPTNGSIASSHATAAEGTTVTITATPNANYQLGTLTVTGDVSGNTYEVSVSDNTGTFTMPAEAVHVSATFYKPSEAYRGFYAWRVKRFSNEMQIKVNGTEYNASQITSIPYIYADTEVEFITSSEEGLEVDFEALWAQAYVVDTRQSTSGWGSYYYYAVEDQNVGSERNFVVLQTDAQTYGFGSGSYRITNSNNRAFTATTRYPDGTTGSNTGAKIGGANISLTANTKFENIEMNMSSYTLNANGKNLTIGRGVTGTVQYLDGLNADYTSGTGFALRVESGTYNYLEFLGPAHSLTAGKMTAILGSDYDRAKVEGGNDTYNEKLRVNTDIYVGYNATLGSSSNKGADAFHCTVKSGNFDLGDYGGGKQFYLSVYGDGGTPHTYGKRTLVVEGGVFSDISGGMDNDEAELSGNLMVDIRIKGGTMNSAVYGAAQHSGAGGDRRMVFTGGRVKGWIAGGCNGTDDDGGELYGSTYIYIGGKTRVVQTGENPYTAPDDPLIGQLYVAGSSDGKGAYGGYIFGAGCGFMPKDISYDNPSATHYIGKLTVGKVFGSTIVVADSCEVGRDIYGGGNFGFVADKDFGGTDNNTNHTSSIYILGGKIHGDVCGGSNNQSGEDVEIYIRGGQLLGRASQNPYGEYATTAITGSVFGGSDTWGTINGSAIITMSGGNVYDVYGGGFGEMTNMAAGTQVNVSGGTIRNNVYGGGALGTVSAGNTDVNISGGTMKNVFGAGKGDSNTTPAKTAEVTGQTDVTVSGGTVDNVYGGGEAGDVVATVGGSYGFESGTTGWTVSDLTGHSNFWADLNQTSNAHSGDHSICVNSNGKNYDQNSYLISPQIDLGGSFSFYAKRWSTTKNDTFRVYLSTTGNSAASDFTIELTNGDVTPGTSYALYNYDLSSYSGQGYVAIVYTAAANQGYLFVDDVTVKSIASTVTINGGTVNEDVFGGGRLGKTYGNVIVNMFSGDVLGNLYGGAFGKRNEVFIAGTHTVNLTGGNIYTNLYGGSRNADDALVLSTISGGVISNETSAVSAVNRMNISGGHVYYQVFAGGYFGHTYGSVYAFVGANAINDAPNASPTAGVSYNSASLIIDGSVWAGADFGSFDGNTFGANTIEGYSNVYIDGLGYNTTSTSPSSAGYMNIGTSVIGTGTSCYAGKLGSTLFFHNYGQTIANPNYSSGAKDGASFEEPFNTTTRNLMSVQFFDEAVFDAVHLHFIGQGRINSLVSTEKYSIYEIKEVARVVNGSSLFLDYPTDQVKKVGSYTCPDVHVTSPVYTTINYDGLGSTPGGDTDNKFRVNNGAYLNIKYLNGYGTGKDYGEIEGFFHIMTEGENSTCAYARPKQSKDAGNQIPTNYDNPTDGGFLSYNSDHNTYTAGTWGGSSWTVAPGTAGQGETSVQMPYENHTLSMNKYGEQYFRIWRYGGKFSYREGMFNARAKTTPGYSTSDVVITLPASRGADSYFRIKVENDYTTIDYGNDVITVNAACYDTVGAGPGGTATNGWMYYSTKTNTFHQTQTVDSTHVAAGLGQLDQNTNANFGLVAIPQGSLEGESNTNWLICNAADGQDGLLPTVRWTNNDQTVNPSILFRLTYNNHITNNATWDPIIITLEQCTSDGTVKDEIKIALSVTTSTTIDQDFGSQAYALMNGNGSAASTYTAKVVLPSYIPFVNNLGDLSDWTFKSATWTPNTSAGFNNDAWQQGSSYVGWDSKFSMEIQPGANFDNTVGWNTYDHTAKDLYYLQHNASVTAADKHLAYSDGRNPCALDFILHYDGTQTCDNNKKMGELAVTLHFTNYKNGTGSDMGQDLVVTIEVFRKGVSANYYIDGVNGNNLYSGDRPDAAKKTLSGVFYRSDYKAGDNIFIVNTVTAKGNALEWNGEEYNSVTIYRYPGGHSLKKGETGVTENDYFVGYSDTIKDPTTHEVIALPYNKDNVGFAGTLVNVENSMAMNGIILDGFHRVQDTSTYEHAGYSNPLYPNYDKYQAPTAPMVTIADGATLTISGNSKLQWNYANCDGSAVYNAGTLNISNGSAICYNAVTAADKEGAGIYMKDGATLLVSDMVTIDTNHVVTHDDLANYSTDPLSNVYLEKANCMIQVGTSDPTDNYSALDNKARIGVTKGEWGEYYYTPIAYSDGGNDYLSNLIPASQVVNEYLIFDDDNTYKLVKINNSPGYTPTSNYLFWVGTWVTKVHEKPNTYDPSTNPVNITNANDLAWAISVVNGLNEQSAAPNTNFNVTADINMGENIWVPMGTETNPYSGTFNANGHFISGINSPLNSTNMGMFGILNGTVENMVVDVDFRDGNNVKLGSVAAVMKGGTIRNVEASGLLYGTLTTEMMGGLVAEVTNGTIHSSFAVNTMMTTTSTETYMGGLIGFNIGSLYNSYSNATMTGVSDTKIGGLVGLNGKNIENCYVVVGSQTFPAFAYENDKECSIKYCYADNANNGYVTVTGAGSTLSGHGTYGIVKDRKAIGYLYDDNAVTLTDVSDSTYVHRTRIDYTNDHTINWNGLLWSLNQWVKANPENLSPTPTPWFRPTTKDINGDLPVLGFGSSNSMAALDDNPKELVYGELDDLLDLYADEKANIFLYGNATNVAKVPTDNVKVFVNEDAVLIQADGAGDFINTTVGITFDNSFGAANSYFNTSGTPDLTYDWHLMSTPLRNAPIGTTYSTTYSTTSGDYYTHTTGTYNTQAMVGDLETLNNSYFPNGLVGNTDGITWDFYTYYEPEYHWINFKRNKKNHFHYEYDRDPGATDVFISDSEGHPHYLINYTGDISADQSDQPTRDNECVFIPGKGYMMAISQDSYMSSTGTLNKGDVTIKVTKTVQNPDWDSFDQGANLIGNPYQAYLDLELVASGTSYPNFYVYIAEQDQYKPYVQSQSKNTATPSRYIHPHQAFFVQKAENGWENFTFSPGMVTATTEEHSYFRDHIDYPLINLNVANAEGAQNYTIIEVNRPELGGAGKVEKLNTTNFDLYARFDQQDYKLLFTPRGTQRVAVFFKTDEDNTYTFSWDTQNGTFDYLRLIDNITGNECDMLTHDHYSFEGHATDYASRFYVVFHAPEQEEPEEQDVFAFFNGSGWMVKGQGQLELIDVTGRILSSQYVSGVYTTVHYEQFAAGVYLLRLGNKTQKIVIK